jgi:hypothetical protein
MNINAKHMCEAASKWGPIPLLSFLLEHLKPFPNSWGNVPHPERLVFAIYQTINADCWMFVICFWLTTCPVRAAAINKCEQFTRNFRHTTYVTNMAICLFCAPAMNSDHTQTNHILKSCRSMSPILSSVHQFTYTDTRFWYWYFWACDANLLINDDSATVRNTGWSLTQLVLKLSWL